jgi:hypothetical protein
MNGYGWGYLIGVGLFWIYVGIIAQYFRVVKKIPNVPLGKFFLTDYESLGEGHERAQNIVAYHGIGIGAIFAGLFWMPIVAYHILKMTCILMYVIGKFLAIVIRKIIWLLLPKETKASIALGTQKQND